MQRRIAAILAADVVGYSRLMAEDETATLAALQAHRSQLVDPAIASHQGRIVKLMGDGALVEFASAVDAVNCAIAIQRGMADRSQDEPEDRRITFRIGINLGDVIVEGEDLYGGGVNIAARLEGLAEPGGICLSGTVHDLVHDKVDAPFEDLGPQRLKNIPEPVRSYKIDLGAAGSGEPVAPPIALAIPDKPSIAVLPFDNMSNDPDQVFFAEGISEDIITELSKFRSLFVIARNSSFAFKGQAFEAKDVGAKLGVRYLVEGSVRCAGKRVRITAQLIDAAEDKHLWAERYDRDLEDIFAVQDEVTQAIVSTLEPQLAQNEQRRARRKPTENLDAWECYQRGLWHLFHFTAEHTEEALRFFQRAVERDPNFASAYGGLAFGYYNAVLFGFSKDGPGDLDRGLAAGQRGVMLDSQDPFAQVGLGRIYIRRGELEAAIDANQTAIGLNPNYATAHQGLAHSLWHTGRAAEALTHHDQAMRLSPRDPLLWVFMASKAIALILLERYEEGLALARQAQRQPNAAIFANVPEISALALLNRQVEAVEAIERARSVKPDLTLAFVETSLPISDAAARAHFIGSLKSAGLD